MNKFRVNDIVVSKFDILKDNIRFDFTPKERSNYNNLFVKKTKMRIIECSDNYFSCKPLLGKNVYTFLDSEIELAFRKKLLVRDVL